MKQHASFLKTIRLFSDKNGWKSSSRNNFPGSTSKPRGAQGSLCSGCVGEWPVMNIPMLMQQLMCLEVTERSCHQRFGGWLPTGRCVGPEGGEWLELGGHRGFEAEGLELGSSAAVFLPVWAIRAAMCVGVEVLNRFFIGKVIGVRPRSLFHRTAVMLFSGLSTAHRHSASCWQFLLCALPHWFCCQDIRVY